MQFFIRYGTDDKVHTTVWLPERKIAIENALWSTPPNVYSIRGDLFRDAREWAALVKLVRNLEPEALIGYGHRPVVGREAIRETLNAYLDGIAFTLDQALALEGKITVPRLVPPQPQFIAAAPQASVDYFRVRIDPAKSGETDKVVRLEFTDGEKPVVGLHVRRAVAEFLPDPDEHYRDADLTIALSGEAWTGLFLSQTTIADLVGSGAAEIRRGSLEQATALFDLFDRYRPERAVLVAPHLHDPH